MPERVEHLLEHAAWLRALARRLAADEHAADDLVQETLVAALEGAPPGGAGRGWLAVVLRNFARQTRRATGRRDARERAAARPEASGADPVAELALQRTLLAAVEALAEPYRTTIVRRYYEGLPPRRIAALDGVPVKTVKTRLARGLALLRARLDGDFGERGAWLAAFQPWLRAAHVPTILGVSLMSVKLKSILAAAVILCVLLIGWRLHTAARAEGSVASAVSVAELASVGVVPEHEATAEPTTTATSREVLAPVAPAVVPLQGAFVHGRVLDLDERPVAGLGVWTYEGHREEAQIDSRAPDAITDAEGAFPLPMPTGNSVAVEASGPDYVTVLAADLWADWAGARPVVIVAPRVRLAGVVLDPGGRPVSDARLAIEPDGNLRSRFTAPVEFSVDAGARVVRTDEAGRFRIDDAPAIRGALNVSAPGYAPIHRPLPTVTREDLVLRFRAVDDDVVVLHGLVVDSSSRPVEAAWVSLHGRCERSGADGGFVFAIHTAPPERTFRFEKGVWVPEGDKGELIAVSRGHLPARLDLPSVDELRAAAARHEVFTLTLGGEPLAIHGRVLDERGRPVAGARVWALEPSDIQVSVGADDRVHTSLESLMRGALDADRVRTDELGFFTLDGLIAKTYAVGALDRPTARFAQTEPIAAGTDGVVIELPALERCVPARGRVLSVGGVPLAGVAVFPRSPTSSALALGSSLATGDKAVTDHDGRFSFAALSPAATRYELSSQGILGADVDRQMTGEEQEIRVPRRCLVQVFGDAAAFGVFDEQGERLVGLAWRGNRGWAANGFAIENGCSLQAAVPEQARFVVLFDAQGVESARKPLQPDPERLVVVRF